MMLPQNKKKANRQLWYATMWMDGTDKKIKRLWFYTENKGEYAIRNPTKCREVWKVYIKLQDKMDIVGTKRKKTQNIHVQFGALKIQHYQNPK